ARALWTRGGDQAQSAPRATGVPDRGGARSRDGHGSGDGAALPGPRLPRDAGDGGGARRPAARVRVRAGPARGLLRSRALGEPEAVTADEGAEVVPLRRRVLAGLVLRPAVRLGVAESLHVALVLLRGGVARLAPLIVGREQGGQVPVVVAVGVHRDRGREAQADEARRQRGAGADGGHPR